MASKVDAKWLSATTLIWISLFGYSETAAQQTDQASPDKGSTIRVSVDSVLVPVVVRDGQGRAIGNLTKEDFQVFDRGKLQKISGLTVETQAGAESMQNVATSPIASTSGAAAPPAAPAGDAEAPPHCTVLLFDDMHLNEGDLMRAKAVATKILMAPLGRREAVAVVSTSGSNSGLTQNSAKLREAVGALSVKNLYRKAGPNCPDIGYYEADRIRNKHDSAAIENAIANYLSCTNTQVG